MSNTDFTKQPEDIILELINDQNPRQVDHSQVEIGEPVAVDGAQTMLEVTAKKGSGYSGSQTFTYNRVEISDVVALDTEAKAVAIDAVAGSDIVAAFNAKFGVNLTASDVLVDGKEIESGYTQPDDYADVSIRAKDESLVWIGEALIRIRPSNELFGMPDGVSVASDSSADTVVRAAEEGVVKVFAI